MQLAEKLAVWWADPLAAMLGKKSLVPCLGRQKGSSQAVSWVASMVVKMVYLMAV